MKTIAFSLFLGIFTANVFAADVPKVCFKKAAEAIEAGAEENYYDQDGINAYNCLIARNKAVVICEVSASKGDGDAYDTYSVVLTKNCSRVLKAKLIGEE